MGIGNCVVMCQDLIERGSRGSKVPKVQEVQLFHGVGIGIWIGIASHLSMVEIAIKSFSM